MNGLYFQRHAMHASICKSDRPNGEYRREGDAVYALIPFRTYFVPFPTLRMPNVFKMLRGESIWTKGKRPSWLSIRLACKYSKMADTTMVYRKGLGASCSTHSAICSLDLQPTCCTKRQLVVSCAQGQG